MNELASDERIKSMEFSANIEIEHIKAQAETVKAAFESVAETVKATSVLVGELYGLSADASFGHQRNALEAAAGRAEERAQQALDTNEKLVDAQIKVMEAQAKALSKGVGTIKIDAQGVEPEVEAFMFKILKQIKIAMTSEQSKFLLGLS